VLAKSIISILVAGFFGTKDEMEMTFEEDKNHHSPIISKAEQRRGFRDFGQSKDRPGQASGYSGYANGPINNPAKG
jgi:hypothetical protein